MGRDQTLGGAYSLPPGGLKSAPVFTKVFAGTKYYKKQNDPLMLLHQGVHGAGDEARTRYLHLGKVALYRMSYTRIWVCSLGT